MIPIELVVGAIVGFIIGVAVGITAACKRIRAGAAPTLVSVLRDGGKGEEGGP